MLSLPETILRDDLLWGFRESFDDLAFLRRIKSPRLGQTFDGQTLDQLVRSLCQKHDICQPFIWAKMIGETGFPTMVEPAGKGYKAPLGFDCQDGGKDPRKKYLGVRNNLDGGIGIWRRYATPKEWDLAKRLRDGMDILNVNPEGQGLKSGHVKPRTLAEAAYLIYTPHLYSLHDFQALLKRYVPEVLAFDGDEAATSEWARKARERLMAAKITDGSNPQGVCTREMVWKMLDAAMGQAQGQPVRVPLVGAPKEG